MLEKDTRYTSIEVRHVGVLQPIAEILCVLNMILLPIQHTAAEIGANVKSSICASDSCAE